MGHTSRHFWVGTDAGVLLFDPTFAKSQPDLFLENYAVSCVSEDAQGNYWIGTLNHGVLVVPNIHVLKYAGKGEAEFVGITRMPGDDSVAIATKQADVYAFGPVGELQHLVHFPVQQLYDVAYADGEMYMVSSHSIGKFARDEIRTRFISCSK